MKERAEKFVESALSDGFTKDQILSSIQNAIGFENKGEQMSVSKILLYIGAIVMVVAGVIYAGLSWQHWTEVIRILVVFAVTAITFLMGVRTWGKTVGNTVSLAFMVVSALLFPIFLIVTYNELNVFSGLDKESELFAIAVAGVTSLAYVVVMRTFKDKIWTLLLSLSVFVTYYFILAYIFPESFLFLKPRMAWFTTLLSVIYVLIGLSLEKIKKPFDASYMYLVGNAILLISTATLVLNNIFILEKVEHAAILAGLVYISLAAVSEYLAKNGFVLFGQIRSFYELFGSLAILVGVFVLGIDGHQFLYESLLLIVSLAFIFSSIPRVSRSYLYSGSIFLVIYIFNISFEYFNDKVGWPLALFIAGLFSMMIGFYIEKIKKKYFQETEEIKG